MKSTKKNNWQYKGDIEFIDSCILCQSQDSIIDIEFSQKLGLIEPFKCKKCSECHLRWLSPRPTQKGYELIYTMDNYFDGDYSPESFTIIEKNRKKLFQNRLQRMKKYLPIDNKQQTILDIGAARGQFIYEAQSAGYDVTGIELSSEAILQAKEKYSIELRQDTLQDLIIQGYKFDIIHMNHVFEHLLDPLECLHNCQKLLNAKGLLVLEVPQQFYNSLDRLKERLKINKSSVFSPYSLHHTYFYTPKTLSDLLTKYQFTICSLRTSNIANTPLWPINFKNTFLAIYLYLSDRLKKSGNIIEVFCKNNFHGE